MNAVDRKRRVKLVLGVMLAGTLFSCASHQAVTSAAAQVPLNVDVQLESTPGQAASERITVTVRDKDRALVTGATVRILASVATVPGGHAMAMPAMGKASAAVDAPSVGEGVYHVDIPVTKAKHWNFVVEVGAAGTKTTLTRDLVTP